MIGHDRASIASRARVSILARCCFWIRANGVGWPSAKEAWVVMYSLGCTVSTWNVVVNVDVLNSVVFYIADGIE